MEEYESALSAQKRHGERILAVESRLNELPGIIDSLGADLVTVSVQGGVIDWREQTAIISALRLEKETLPLVLKRLNEEMIPIRNRVARSVVSMQEAEATKQREELLEKLNEMRIRGESPKTIREELNLNQYEFERLATR